MALLTWSFATLAHTGSQEESSATIGLSAVRLDLWASLPLSISIALYVLGLRRLWRLGIGNGIKPAQAVAFGAGWLVLVVCLVWPLDALADWLLAAHMTQHMLLVALAPPLLLLGIPGAVWLAAIPTNVGRFVMRPLRRAGPSMMWRALTAPTLAMFVQAAVMWLWHLPAAMEAALRSELLHIIMHLSFLLAGLLFWTGVLRSLREPAVGAGAGLIALVGTMMHMGLLGALMTFAGEARYAHYFDRAPHLGLTALEDQQLAGLIMWVPAAIPYLVGGVWLAAAWLSRVERQQRRSARPGSP